MKKSLLFLLFIVLSTNILIAQPVTGKLINQMGIGLSGLQLKLYVNSKSYSTESSSDGSFTFGNLTGVVNTQLPTGYTISDCYPNPFSQTTRIDVTLPKGGNVKIDVYNLQGQKVKAMIDQYFNPGENDIDIDLRGLGHGNYLAKIIVDNQFTVARKMVFQNGSVQSIAVANNVRLKSASVVDSEQGTKIDSLVVSGASINRKVFLNLPALSGASLNLGNLTVTETNNLLDGASFFSGSVPAIGLVTYHEGENLVTDSAYLGQAFIFFDASIGETNATSIIKANGGSILTKVPNAGYYLAGVSIGNEGAFIDALRNNKTVKTALPNIVASYMSSYVTVIDGCGKSHGSLVSCTVNQNTPNGTYVTCMNDDDSKGNPFTPVTVENILKTLKTANGGNAIINISSFGGLNRVDYEKQDAELKDKLLRMAKDYLSAILTPISQLPDSWTKNLVITFCAGNDNTPLASVLAELRSDNSIAKVLNNNVLIVGANESVYHDSNDAPGDPDFGNMKSVTSPCGSEDKKGTSFAAPLGAAYISNLVNVKGISARQALKAAKIAISQNPKNEFIEGEAQLIAELIKNGKVYSGEPFSVSESSPRSNGECTLTFVMRFNMTIIFDGDFCEMILPAHFSWSMTGGDCEIEDYPTDQVFKGNLTVSNNAITGRAETVFALDSKHTFPATTSFSGTLNANGTITGTLSVASQFINQTTSVILTNQ